MKTNPESHQDAQIVDSPSNGAGNNVQDGGQFFWRNLEELNSPSAPGELAESAFPPVTSGWDDVSRRGFIKVMGASMALGGLTACTKQPSELIVPYVKPPEEAVPGQPLQFATVFSLGGYAQGILVESHLGRPTKVEGNPNHPASLGSTDTFAQASVLGLYDPDRSKTPRKLGRPSTWPRFLADLEGMLADEEMSQGRGIRILTGAITSPTAAAQLKAIQERYSAATWHQYESLNRDNVLEGAKLSFGRYVDTLYDFAQASVVLSLDADFMVSSPAFARAARDVASRRNPDEPDRMNRIYAAETNPSVTGASADHRVPVRSSDMESVARAVARGVGVQVEGEDSVEGIDAFLHAVIDDLKNHKGSGIVVAGDSQPPVVHALVHAINHELGNHGHTVTHIRPVAARAENHTESIKALTAAMKGGEVSTLVMLGVNPVYEAPSDLGFEEAMGGVSNLIHLGLYFDETGRHCHWHIPQAHYLEDWSDARAFDGTTSIVQPLIEPIYGGNSIHEVLAAMAGNAGKRSIDLLQEYWKEQRFLTDDEKAWRRALHDGVIADTASKRTRTSFNADFPPTTPKDDGIELNFRADPATYDGRFANNAWLQELPRPITSLTWDNAALMSKATADKLGIDTVRGARSIEKAPTVRITRGEQSITLPVLVAPGHAPQSITVALGYGRLYGGRVAAEDGNPVGVDVNVLRTADAFWTVADVKVKRTGAIHKLATTQHHPTVQEWDRIKGRHHYREGTIAEYSQHPDHPGFVHDMRHTPSEDMTLFWQKFDYSSKSTDNAWAMAIDLSKCIGCNACTIACQAENNIPVVGKDQVLAAREMHWIRVDKYFEGDVENPKVHNQPIPCMHCETAPCETVCPVGATVHSAEGLNQMVYNRCVGTRYCSNNCPYKVRRFNFFKYADDKEDWRKAVRNPDVTVRYRGVMEKCTYCVQRINRTRIKAKREGNRPIEDGEVVTACQQVCPTQAIVFGNMNDPDSHIAKARKSGLNYGVLAEVNTRPRTTYHAKVRNPNPALSGGVPGSHENPSDKGNDHG
jgi:molybdopterin-containing oxidoreductase family iron-sulfur binding subunit